MRAGRGTWMCTLSFLDHRLHSETGSSAWAVDMNITGLLSIQRTQHSSSSARVMEINICATPVSPAAFVVAYVCDNVRLHHLQECLYYRIQEEGNCSRGCI